MTAEVLAAIEAHDPAAAQEFREAFAVGGFPAPLASALHKHALDDPEFMVENVRCYLVAREDGAEEDCLAFLEQDGPEMILKAHDGTPTPADLREALGDATDGGAET